MEKTDKIRLMIVDDHPIMREGLTAIIRTQSDMQIVAEGENGKQAVELFRKHRPDIVVMDLGMPLMNGVEACSVICKEFPAAQIIVLTVSHGDADITRALQAGARAYLLKESVADELLSAVRTIKTGRRCIPPDVAARLVEGFPESGLTKRELEVLRLIVDGKANKQIADVLSITEASVKGHVSNILSKLGAGDRTEAVTIGLRRGIVHLE